MAERIHLIRIGHGYAISGSLLPATIGDAYSRTLTALGGRGIKRLEIVSETVPDAIVFTDNGDNTAEFAMADPQTPGTYSVVVRATDANRQRWTRTFRFQIIALPLTISDTLPDITVAAVYLQTLQINDGIPPYFLNQDTVPAGMSASISGDEIVVEGPATGAGLGPGTTFPFTVEFEVEDSSVPPQTATYSQELDILVPVVVASYTSLPDAEEDSPWTGQATASGGVGTDPSEYEYEIITGPAWISIDDETGELTGTPDSGDIATGVTITVRATDSEGNYDDVTDTIDVEAIPLEPAFSATDKEADAVLSGDDRILTCGAGGANQANSVLSRNRGKWHIRFRNLNHVDTMGCGFTIMPAASNAGQLGDHASGWALRGNYGGTALRLYNSTTHTNYPSITFTTNDYVDLWIDVKDGKAWWGINGTPISGSPSAGTGAMATFPVRAITQLAADGPSGASWQLLTDPSEILAGTISGFTDGWLPSYGDSPTLVLDIPMESNFNDSVGHTVNVFGATINTSSPIHGAGDGLFDGTDDYVAYTDAADLDIGTGDYEISYYVNHDDFGAAAGGTNQCHWSRGLQFAALVGLSGQLLYYKSGTVFNAGVVMTATTTHLIRWVRAGSTMALYVDRAYKGTWTDSGSLDYTGDWLLGCSQAATFGFLDGRLDAFTFIKY